MWKITSPDKGRLAQFLKEPVQSKCQVDKDRGKVGNPQNNVYKVYSEKRKIGQNGGNSQNEQRAKRRG